MMVDRQDIGHLMKATKAWASFRHALRLVARHLKDRLTHPRGTRLLIGNALVGRFLYSLQKRKVPVWTRTAVTAIRPLEDGALEVQATREGQRQTLRASRGVVLAAGGFSRHETLRRERLGDIAPYSPVAPGNTGGGIELALSLGGRMGRDGYEPVQWAPVSARVRADGTTAVFPHFIMDRAKPGTMVVNQRGERFLNEALSYHQFGHAMREANTDGACIPAYLVADRQAMLKYGLGMVRPGTRDVSSFLAEGYLFEGQTLAELARRLGMAPAALVQSAQDISRAADRGVDTAFGRGGTVYQRNIGDPAAPHPNLGRMEHAPFYAVRIYPGDIGAASGLLTDIHANVLDANDRPIAGLYAAGNDMHSVMGGTYPGPGITIGPAITFAYRAVEHALAGAPASTA
jgi:succinate dehydrogenase/fumarate reductase flavoprotein subunit